VIDDSFLLLTPLARRLYHEYACHLPLIDYHNHLSIAEIAADRRFPDLTELWLQSDPYKHRAMRICGVEERRITGDADPYDKFLAWCTIFPSLIGNPLYHWSILELKRFLDIDWPINAETADMIWRLAQEKLSDPAFSAQSLLRRFNVAYTAPCTAISADLSPFAACPVAAPSLRGDDLVPLSADGIARLAAGTGSAVDSLGGLAEVLEKRLDDFHAAGCRFADHALDHDFRYVADDGCNEARFQKLLCGGVTDAADMLALSAAVLRLLGAAYARRGWVMQLHIGALRNTSSRLRRVAGQAGGFAGIGSVSPEGLTAFLDDLEQGPAGLPRTVLFTINPADNAVLSVLSGSFCQDGVRAKVQQGPAWWWCDHLTGMREHFECISAFGVLSTFIGMTTDSRCFPSLVRHEYFRRALCGWLGDKAQRGELPDSTDDLAGLVRAVCYGNAQAILTGANTSTF
jgi:glucuronate isomerase